MSSRVLSPPWHDDPGPRYLTIGLGCLASAVLLLFGVILAEGSASGTAIAVTMAFGALLVGVVTVRARQSSLRLFDPLALFCVVLFFYFVLHFFWIISSPFDPSRGIARPFSDALPRSQELLGGGCLALLVGYLLAGGAKSGKPERKRAARSFVISNKALFFVFIVGMIFQYLSNRSGGAYNSKNVLIYATLGYSAFTAYVAALLKLQDSPANRFHLRLLVYGVMIPVQAFWALAHGSKTSFVVVVVAYLVVRQVRGTAIRVRWLALAAVVFVGVITPIVDQARANRAHPNSLVAGALATRFAHSVMHPAIPSLHGLAHGYDLIQERTGGSDSLALAVKYTPSLRPFQWGRSLAAVPLALVPHFLWPNKPYYSVGRDFSVIYAGQQPSQGAGLTVAATIPGDLYMNFGTPGIIFGFLVIGMVLRWMARLVEGAGASDLRVLVFVSLLIQCLLLEQDLGVVLEGALTHLGAVFLFTGLLYATARRRRTAVA